jgi:hypothetical protein
MFPVRGAEQRQLMEAAEVATFDWIDAGSGA